MSEYSFPIEITDTSVAFDCEADRAERAWTPPMGHLDPQCSKALRDRGVQ